MRHLLSGLEGSDVRGGNLLLAWNARISACWRLEQLLQIGVFKRRYGV